MAILDGYKKIKGLTALNNCAKRSDLSDQFYVYRIQAFFTVLQIKLHSVVFFDLIDESACMDKGLFTGIIMLDKSKSFVGIEELYGACCFSVHH